MNPNPRSETNFLMVPVGISLLPFSKAISRTRGPFREVDDRGARIARHSGRQPYLTTEAAGVNRSESEHADADQSGHRAGQFHGCGLGLAKLPHPPNCDADDSRLAHRRDHRKWGEAKGPEHYQVDSPHQQPYHYRLPASRWRS